jgi:hypothetical protein
MMPRGRCFWRILMLDVVRPVPATLVQKRIEGCRIGIALVRFQVDLADRLGLRDPDGIA